MTEKKLTIDMMAPYLPYGLKMRYLVWDRFEREGIMTKIIHNEAETHPTKISIDYYDAEHIWMFKPYLRPLSQLTQEIEHNGEIFVPIEYIARNTFPFDEKISTAELGFDEEECWCNILIGGSVAWCISFNFHSKNFRQEIEEYYMLYSQYECNKLLFSIHFDVFGLIEQGLALPIED